MINKETVKFIALLNELARETKHGIYPLSTVTENGTRPLAAATEEQKNGFIYDDKKPMVVDCSANSYPPTRYYRQNFTPYLEAVNVYGEAIVVRVKVDAFVPDDVWIEVFSKKDGDICFVVKDGHWLPLIDRWGIYE